MMAKGANGTIQINTQTIKQREKFGRTSNGKFGVATDRLGSAGLFPLSPIAPNTEALPMYIGDESGGALLLQTGSATVYDVYAKVIDPELDAGLEGFGFSNQTTDADVNYGKAFLNYRHPMNPFRSSSNYKDLSDGSKHGSVKAYKGFPDLQVGDIADPGANQLVENIESELVSTDDVNLALSGDGASYGSETAEYRSAISGDSMLGKHVESGSGNGGSDKLGTYFKNNYTS